MKIFGINICISESYISNEKVKPAAFISFTLLILSLSS